MEKQTPSYAEAVKRLETIVAKIENGEMDIDTLSSQLKEAKELVALCKKKLTKVDAEVKKILED